MEFEQDLAGQSVNETDASAATEKPPAPLLKASDIKAKRAAENLQDEETEEYTYDIKNEEHKPLEKKFKSQSTVKARRRAAAAVITILALLALLFGGSAVYASAYSRIYPNISIMGEDCGGMTREAVLGRLHEKYDNVELKAITVECENSQIEVDPYALGTVFQIDETVDYAYNLGRNEGVIGKIRGAVFKSHPAEDVALMVSLDKDALKGMIDGLVSPYENYSADRYEIAENEITFIKGEKGLRVDRDMAADKIISEISSLNFSPVRLTPELTDPIELNADEVYSEITAEAAAPFYALENGSVVVKKGKPRVEIDKSEVESAIKKLNNDSPVSVECKTEFIGPTEEELSGRLFRDVMGSYKTSFSPYNSARCTNVRLAASRIDGTILMPGETFSYDSTIGARTVANGYKEANVYTNNKVDVGIGGGICQTSSTLYSAVLYANLEIVSRTSHSLPVSYIPAGQDATIAQGSIDFKFRNNTDYPVRISATTTSSSISCSILGTNIDNTSVKLEHTVTNKTEDGSFSVSSQRIVLKDGAEIRRERLSKSHYNAIQPDPTESPEPSESPAPSDGTPPDDTANE